MKYVVLVTVLVIMLSLVSDVFTLKSDKEIFQEVESGLTLSDLDQGCFTGKDCIPSIDSPKFETFEEADKWLSPEDIVFGININGIQKAYPQRIMNWHEIVNDQIDNQFIAVTFCPLCGTAETFIRQVDGKVVEFGVSGKLYNSDLVMYDRTEESYWQQITGEAIIGTAYERGEVLKKLPTTTTTWSKWSKRYPNTLVLSRKTGYDRNYDFYPYNDYETNDELLFEVSTENNELHKKEIVYGIQFGDTFKAYTKAYLDDNIAIGDFIEDSVGSRKISIAREAEDEYIFKEVATQMEINYLRSFWFAWYAFYPSTEIMK